MQTKFLVIALGVLVLITIGVGAITLIQNREDGVVSLPVPEEKPIPPTEGTEKLKAETFIGTLELVDTGCFADGECYVMVDGKHVTALMGWSRDTVGSVVGVSGFGDLEQYLGKKVEVYAQVAGEGQYTLYGSEGFYIKLLENGSAGGGVREGIAVGEPYPDVPGDEPKPQIVNDGCVVGGCSGQICTDAKTGGDMVTTCEYRAEYACYQVATCERQTSGQCGWTMTDELRQCISQAENEPFLEVN